MANIAPFFLNETFPPNWYRQFPTYNIVNLVNDLVYILQSSGAQTPLGQNEGINNFIVSGIDPSKLSPEQVVCMLLEAVMELSPGFISPMVAQNSELVISFLEGK